MTITINPTAIVSMGNRVCEYLWMIFVTIKLRYGCIFINIIAHTHSHTCSVHTYTIEYIPWTDFSPIPHNVPLSFANQSTTLTRDGSIFSTTWPSFSRRIRFLRYIRGTVEWTDGRRTDGWMDGRREEHEFNVL